MAVVLLALVFVLSVFAGPIAKGKYYDCGKIIGTEANRTQAIDECKKTGWCYWSSNACFYDQVLQPIKREDFDKENGNIATLCTGPQNDIGGTTIMQYITDIHECTTCQTKDFTDIYCREGNPSFQRKDAIGKCFYADLEFRQTNPDVKDVPKVLGVQCIKNDTLKEDGTAVGYYVYDDPSYTPGTDCSLLTVPEVCPCLGKISTSWCHLHPWCTLNKAGNACIQDPCTQNNPGSTKGNDCVPAVSGCTTSSQLWSIDSQNSAAISYLCVATASNPSASVNNDTNECYGAYQGSSVPGKNCPDDAECRVTSEVDKCDGQKQNDKDGKQIEEVCKLVSLPDGYFPLNKYCNDGRTVPSLSGASIARVPLLVFAAIVLALLY